MILYPSSSPVSHITWFPSSSLRAPSVLAVRDAENRIFFYEQCLDSSFPLFQLRESLSSPGGVITWAFYESSADAGTVADSVANRVGSAATAASRFQSAACIASPFQSWHSEEALLLFYAQDTVQLQLLQHRPPSSLQESSLSLQAFSLPLQLDSCEVGAAVAQMVGRSRIRITLLAGSTLTMVDVVRDDGLRQVAMHSQRIGNECGLIRVVESSGADARYLTVDDRNRLLFWSEHVCLRSCDHL